MTITNEQAIGYMKMAIAEMKLSVSESRSDKKAVPKVGAVLVWPDGETKTAS